jgi:hypothetical protein
LLREHIFFFWHCFDAKLRLPKAPSCFILLFRQAICETEPEQPVRHYPLWVKVEGEVDPEPVYVPTPSVIEPMKPLLLPQPEVLSTTVKGKLLTGVKTARAYTPKPNPVVSLEFDFFNCKFQKLFCKSDGFQPEFWLMFIL